MSKIEQDNQNKMSKKEICQNNYNRLFSSKINTFRTRKKFKDLLKKIPNKNDKDKLKEWENELGELWNKYESKIKLDNSLEEIISSYCKNTSIKKDKDKEEKLNIATNNLNKLERIFAVDENLTVNNIGVFDNENQKVLASFCEKTDRCKPEDVKDFLKFLK